MFRIVRATGHALAALTVAFGATYSRPSLAWETEAVPVIPTYLGHAAASPDTALTDEAAVTVEPALYDPNLSPDIAEHAVAPTLADATEPAVGPGRSLRELVQAYAGAEAADPEHECLAGAVYFESKGEPLHGQLAVAEVVLNRASSGKFPTSICGVVKQKSQFSFVRGGRIPSIPKASEAWRKAVAIAHIARKDLAEGGAGKAMFFHARYVSPRWRLTRVATIGNHIFYR